MVAHLAVLDDVSVLVVTADPHSSATGMWVTLLVMVLMMDGLNINGICVVSFVHASSCKTQGRMVSCNTKDLAIVGLACGIAGWFGVRPHEQLDTPLQAQGR